MITRLRSGRELELRAFALTDMARYGWSDMPGLSSFGEREMRGIPAIGRAARLRAEALGNLELCCYSGEGPERIKRDGPGIWQAQLFKKPANEYQTRFGFWETVGESLAYRNNAYIWKTLDTISGRILEWFALHPDQVECKGDYYVVTVASGYVDPVGRGPAHYEVDESTILHIRGHGQGGMLEAPTPVQVYRNALSGPVGRQRHEARMWRRGTALQVAVEFPAGISPQQADEWREGWRSNYEGTEGETTAVIGGGATIKPIGMTATDAQFVEMAKLTVEDAARIMGVPANLLGVQLGNTVPNLEQDLMTWLRFGLGPELGRIESALEADQELFGNAQTYPLFDTENFVRGSIEAEAQVLVSLVQAGIITPDEARHTRGLDDLPYGAGAIPQITPVGGAPNPAVAAVTNGASEAPGY